MRVTCTDASMLNKILIFNLILKLNFTGILKSENLTRNNIDFFFNRKNQILINKDFSYLKKIEIW